MHITAGLVNNWPNQKLRTEAKPTKKYEMTKNLLYDQKKTDHQTNNEWEKSSFS